MSTPPMATSLNEVSFSSPELEASPPFMRTNRVNEFSGKIGGHELKNQKPGTLLGNFAEQWQSYPMYSGAMPVSPAMHAYQLIPTVPIPRIEVIASAYQQQYYLDPQSPAYMSLQHLSRSSMEWRNVEEERFCRMNQQYDYPQQHQNQGPIVHQIPISADIAVRPSTGSTMLPYFEMLCLIRLNRAVKIHIRMIMMFIGDIII